MNRPNNLQKTTRKVPHRFPTPKLTPCEVEGRAAWRAVHWDGAVQVIVGSYEDARASVERVIVRANAREAYFRHHSAKCKIKLL